MPRKPSSLFVIAAVPNQSTTVVGMPPSQHQAWRIPLEDGDTVESVVERWYRSHPVGTDIYVVEDTKVDAFQIGLTLNVVDDARLSDDEEGHG